MTRNKGTLAAQALREECGIWDPIEIPLETIVAGRGAYLRFEPLDQADGRIVFGDNSALITINSDIKWEGRKRFALAHELGHYEMHRDILEVHNDNPYTLDWFQKGNHEFEANRFACEFLMPAEIFQDECSGKIFNPNLLRTLADRFKTSITSVVYRYLELGPHPICIFYIKDNRIQYWKKSDEFKYWIPDRIKLEPPENSVAAEYYSDGIIYSVEESQQEIDKSTWFELQKQDEDSPFFEYCIITKTYNTVLSVLWED